MRRRKIQENEENSHCWLVSCADFITLLSALKYRIAVARLFALTEWQVSSSKVQLKAFPCYFVLATCYFGKQYASS